MTDESKKPTVKDIPISFLQSKIPGNTDEELKTKTLRRDFLKLYESDDEADKEELDRAMIAFYRLQTEGYVAYRRLIGTHGGGGGAKNERRKKTKKKIPYNRILARKVKLDVGQHYNNYRSEKYNWPDLCLFAPRPETFGRGKSKDNDQTPFTYAFCWHARVEFSVWHRPFMREYERLLQKYDPAKSKEEERFKGSKALGAHYWAWEEWDGKNLPEMLSKERYTIRTDKYNDIGDGEFAKGKSIRNPYHKWVAPVSVKEQLNEVLPDISKKPSTRNTFFDKENTEADSNKWVNKPNEEPREWNFGDKDNKDGFVPTIKETMQYSMTEPRFMFFSSIEFAGNRSIEHGHNQIHNYIGGGQDGVFQGYLDTFNGTMTTLQSPFDPVFMLHHSNVERHLCGWQRKFWTDSNKWKELSAPWEAQATRKMYPWTKPSQLEEEERYFWNTRPGYKSDQDKFTGTLQEWFDTELTYVYDEYLQPPANGYTLPLDSLIVSITSKKKLTSGNYQLVYNNNTVLGAQARLGSDNADCANCQQKAATGDTLRFPVANEASSKERFDAMREERKAAMALLKKRNENPKKKIESDLDFKRSILKNLLRILKDGKDISDWFDWSTMECKDPDEVLKNEEVNEQKRKEQWEKEQPDPEDEADDADLSDY